MEKRGRTYQTITSQPWYRFIRDIAGSRYAYGNRRRSFSGVIMRRRQRSLRPTSTSTGHRLLGSLVIRHSISRTTAAAGRRKPRQQWWANSKLICHLCWQLIMRELIDWFIASPRRLCCIRRSRVCVSNFLWNYWPDHHDNMTRDACIFEPESPIKFCKLLGSGFRKFELDLPWRMTRLCSPSKFSVGPTRQRSNRQTKFKRNNTDGENLLKHTRLYQGWENT